jgi:hypothetical protein
LEKRQHEKEKGETSENLTVQYLVSGQTVLQSAMCWHCSLEWISVVSREASDSSSTGKSETFEVDDYLTSFFLKKNRIRNKL